MTLNVQGGNDNGSGIEKTGGGKEETTGNSETPAGEGTKTNSEKEEAAKTMRKRSHETFATGVPDDDDSRVSTEHQQEKTRPKARRNRTVFDAYGRDEPMRKVSVHDPVVIAYKGTQRMWIPPGLEDVNPSNVAKIPYRALNFTDDQLPEEASQNENHNFGNLGRMAESSGTYLAVNIKEFEKCLQKHMSVSLTVRNTLPLGKAEFVPYDLTDYISFTCWLATPTKPSKYARWISLRKGPDGFVSVFAEKNFQKHDAIGIVPPLSPLDLPEDASEDSEYDGCRQNIASLIAENIGLRAQLRKNYFPKMLETIVTKEGAFSQYFDATKALVCLGGNGLLYVRSSTKDYSNRRSVERSNVFIDVVTGQMIASRGIKEGDELLCKYLAFNDMAHLHQVLEEQEDKYADGGEDDRLELVVKRKKTSTKS